MKKYIAALGLLVMFASCKKREYTCSCVDLNSTRVFQKTLTEFNYSEIQMYCDQVQRDYAIVGNSVTCKVEGLEETE